MEKSKVVGLLKKLSKKEFFELETYLISPFFGINESILQLFLELSPHFPRFKHPSLNKELIFAKVFPGVPYDNGKFNYLLSDFHNIILDFLGTKLLLVDQLELRKGRVRALQKKKIWKDYERELHRFEKDLNEATCRDMFYYQNLHFLETKKAASGEVTPLQESKIILEKTMQALDEYFVLGKLRLTSEILSRTKILGEKYEPIRLYPDIKQVTTKELRSGNPLIEAFHYILKLIENNKLEVYKKAKHLLFENEKVFSVQLQSEILLHLMNFIVHKSLQIGWDQHLVKEYFDLAKFGFLNKIFLVGEAGTENTFHNMIIFGTRLQEFEWLDEFLTEVEKDSNQGYAQDVVIFARATYYYAKGAYKEARKLLTTHKFSRNEDKVRVKTMTVRLLFEEYLQDDQGYTVVLSNIESFRKFLKRNKKLPEHRIASYYSFLKVTRELVQYRFFRKNLPHRKAALLQIIEDEKPPNRDWLREKLEDFF